MMISKQNCGPPNFPDHLNSTKKESARDFCVQTRPVVSLGFSTQCPTSRLPKAFSPTTCVMSIHTYVMRHIKQHLPFCRVVGHCVSVVGLFFIIPCPERSARGLCSLLTLSSGYIMLTEGQCSFYFRKLERRSMDQKLRT